MIASSVVDDQRRVEISDRFAGSQFAKPETGEALPLPTIFTE
jgi:hypothetical protein